MLGLGGGQIRTCREKGGWWGGGGAGSVHPGAQAPPHCWGLQAQLSPCREASISPKHRKSLAACLSACFLVLSPRWGGASICQESHWWVDILLHSGLLHMWPLSPPSSLHLPLSFVCRRITQKSVLLAVSSKSKWDFPVGIRIPESPACRIAQQYIKQGWHLHWQCSEQCLHQLS